jgi:hypothetical protein
VSIEGDIMTALAARVATVPDIVSINTDRIKLATSDFRDFEIPAVQIWDIAQTPEHQRGRILVNWALSLEIIMKSLETGEVNQAALWDLRRQVQQAIWLEPNLGIPGVVHLIYTGNITDLHLVEPFYIARIDFDVQFYDDLTGSC